LPPVLKIGKHIILWIVALSILNTSIDIVDDGAVFQSLTDQADDGVSYTEIESIVEYLVNETTDHEEQFPDSTGNDQQSILKKAAGFQQASFFRCRKKNNAFFLLFSHEPIQPLLPAKRHSYFPPVISTASYNLLIAQPD